ncbi:MAG: TIGR04372 family glycosyltransferase, partial [Schwartzia sp.]|nr:TIGR04372 family glycosyltransferase [Schwartzia sp. (in: firmicutes)]
VFIPQAISEWHEERRRKDNDILHLYIATSRLGNARVEKIIARTLHLLVNNEERYFWIYYIFHMNKKIKNEDIVSEWLINLVPSAPYEIKPSWTMKYITMTNEEEREGEKKAKEMGLTGEFVCIANRESAFDAKECPGSSYGPSQVVRNSDIYTRADAAKYLSSRSIQCVRMGSVVAQHADFPNCIDYASDFYDELMDVWLIKHCKFWVSDEFGINLLARAMNKRCVTTNLNNCTLPFPASEPLRDDDIYIIKRLKNMEDGKMLTLEEIAQVSNLLLIQRGNLASNIDELGLEVVDNTSTDIMEAVQEMNERMDGTWIETVEDRVLQERYQSKLRDFYRKYGDLYRKFGYNTDVSPGLIGTQFLRNHMDLLDQVDSRFMHLCDGLLGSD